MYSYFILARKYISYWFTSSNNKGHGVHSPFVFDFITSILNDKKEQHAFIIIEQLRSQLYKKKSFIEVEDFGAGSGLIKSNKRRIDKIAKSSLKPKKYAQLLYRIVQYYKPKTIIELGTSFGLTTAYLAKANETATIFTFEGSKSIANISLQHFKKLALTNVNLILGEFSTTLPEFISNNPTIDFAFIDGNHRKKPTLDYFKQLLPLTNEKSIIIFDDIHWSPEMESAWNEIKQHPSVTLSIDLFFIGLVFFKNDFKVKQHFTIQF